jgi:hypothetical protein
MNDLVQLRADRSQALANLPAAAGLLLWNQITETSPSLVAHGAGKRRARQVVVIQQDVCRRLHSCRSGARQLRRGEFVSAASAPRLSDEELLTSRLQTAPDMVGDWSGIEVNIDAEARARENGGWEEAQKAKHTPHMAVFYRALKTSQLFPANQLS